MFTYAQSIEPTATPAGEFTDGNSVAGVARTVMLSFWPNMIQRELLAVLVAAGVTPDQATFNQVATAIQTLINLAQLSAVTTANNGLIGTITSGPYLVIPANSLVLEGGIFNRADYPLLWAYISANFALVADATTATNPGAFTSGDGATTFRLPDLRGLFVRGANGANSAALGVLQTDAIRNITGSLQAAAGAGTGGAFQSAGNAGGFGGVSGVVGKLTFDASQVVPTANENRPTNVAWRWIIRAK